MPSTRCSLSHPQQVRAKKFTIVVERLKRLDTTAGDMRRTRKQALVDLGAWALSTGRWRLVRAVREAIAHEGIAHD